MTMVGFRDTRGAAHTMYIFQLMLQRRGGTAKARIQFQVQFEACRHQHLHYLGSRHDLPVARDTAFARTFAGKISLGYVQLVGPQVVAKEATKR